VAQRKKTVFTISPDAAARLAEVIISPEVPLKTAIAQLDRAGTGALVLSEGDGRLFGLLTDGDIRRAILRNVSLDEPCGSAATLHPYVATSPVSAADALTLMASRDINHLPVLSPEGRLVEFVLRRDLIREDLPTMSAVVMAGGFGTRLLPLTAQTPKPMLPLGDKPLLERTIERLRDSGINRVSLTTHYLSDSIVEHFGDGRALGVDISYSREDEPLGTAGGLKKLAPSAGPFVVINGDILTGVSFQDMLLYHRKHGADMTVGVRAYEMEVPFGVIECEDVRVTRLREKPTFSVLVNAGVYLLEPEVIDLIPSGHRFDMTDLIGALVADGKTVVSFPIIEYWQDVGRHEDYEQAQEDHRNGRI
jgi:dTDP-glucose pyrophosphorylase